MELWLYLIKHISSDINIVYCDSVYIESFEAFGLNAVSISNKRKKDCLWKHRTHYGLENGNLGFIETLHKQ